MSESCEVDCAGLPTSAYVDCGPVQPATAVGGKLLALMKSCVRFTITMPARCLEWAQSFTLVTFCTALFLVATYTMFSLSFFDARTVCLSTTSVLRHYQVYRIFTYTIFHSKPLHVVVNIVFLGSVGRTLEGKLGSYYFLNVVLVFGTSCALLQMLLEQLISRCYPAILDQCLSGFSGVLFGILVLALRVTKNKKQSVYVFCYIRKSLYPWLLLLVCQLITYEHISIIANFAGIVIGYAYMNDYLNCVKLSPYTIVVLERSELCHWVSGLPGFVHYPKNSLIPLTSSAKHSRTLSKKLKEKGKLKGQHGGSGQPSAHQSGTLSLPNHLQLGNKVEKSNGSKADVQTQSRTDTTQ